MSIPRASRKLLLVLLVQLQLQHSWCVTQLLPIQVPNSSYHSSQSPSQNSKTVDNSYDTDSGDYYSSGPTSPIRGGKLYLKSGLPVSDGNSGGLGSIGSGTNSLLNTLSSYGSKWWPSSSEDSSVSGSGYGLADSSDASTIVGSNDGTSYGTLGSGTSFSPSDSSYTLQDYGSDSGSYRYGQGQGQSASHFYPLKTYQYQVYPGSKGWTSHMGHKHLGHHHHHLSNVGWNSGWNGWTYGGNGWANNDLDIGHDIFETVGAWLGIKAIKGATIINALKALAIIVPAAILVILLILLLPIPVIIIPNPQCPGARQLEGPVTSFTTPIIGRSRLWKETGRLTELVLKSDSCIERISCEIGKVARKYHQNHLIDTLMKYLPASTYTERISRSLNDDGIDTTATTTHGSGHFLKNASCKKFTCDPVGRLKKEFYRIWNKSLSTGTGPGTGSSSSTKNATTLKSTGSKAMP